MSRWNPQEPIDLVLSRTIIDESGCWLFQGRPNKNGYATVHKNLSVHRTSYEYFVGPIPGEMVVDHACHDPEICQLGGGCPHRRCVNPDHLRLLTTEENVRRAYSAYAERTHCKNGHEFVPENMYVQPNRSGRVCRLCMLKAQREYQERKKQNPVDA
jgi:HNH endonuclease